MPKKIIHMLFTGAHASPFDVNMAIDAGYDVAVPYTNVSTEAVTALVQDSIYSRPPGYFNHSGLFVGGNDVNAASDMVASAGAAMEKPFELSVMADPNGAYTTSAALVAMIEHQLRSVNGSLQGSNVVILGGGPVGLSAAVLVARQGATPVLARLLPGTADKQAAMEQFLARYEVTAKFIDAQNDDLKRDVLADADVLISAAKAGLEVVSADVLQAARRTVVAADVNAVPPAGIAGVGVMDACVPLTTIEGCASLGALAIGNIKYKTQQQLLQRMLNSESAVVLDFLDAYDSSLELVSN